MRFFSLNRDVTVHSSLGYHRFPAVSGPEAAEVGRVFLDIGLVLDQVRRLVTADEGGHGTLSTREATQTNIHKQKSTINIAVDSDLVGWPGFPVCLGRQSRHGDDLIVNDQANVLPDQLVALRRAKADKVHFRFLFVNGFGTNLGDSTVGCTVLRQVLACMRRWLPQVSCDLILGPGPSPALAALFATEPGVERVLYHTLSLSDMALYDGCFDLTELIFRPRYDELPMVDWGLWWCGLDPEAVASSDKRNSGQIDPAVFAEVTGLLALTRLSGMRCVLFNPKASTPLRTMPETQALHFAEALLELAPDLQLVIDQPLAVTHERLSDLSAHIDSPEKLKALIAQVDGVISVDTFAIHWADACSVPTVGLCASIEPDHYRYYPYFSAVGMEHFRALPGYQKSKLPDEVWRACKDDYTRAWAKLCPALVLAALEQNISRRNVAASDELNVVTVQADSWRSELALLPDRYRLSSEHIRVSQRVNQLMEPLLKPGMTCVMAGVPDSALAVALAQKLNGDIAFGGHGRCSMSRQGQLIVVEPRRLQARMLQHRLYQAGNLSTRVEAKMPVAEAGAGAGATAGGVRVAQIAATDPWFESRSEKWGNGLNTDKVELLSVDALELNQCACVVIQSPLNFSDVLLGAQSTLSQCRPVVLMGAVVQDQAVFVCELLESAGYECWAEVINGGAGGKGILVVAVPAEKPIHMRGFQRVRSR